MDKGTATKYHFRVGDRVRVLSGAPPTSFTISGIVTFGAADNLAGATLAGFYLPTAQALFNTRGHYDTINILAKPGADNVRLQRAIARILPPGVQVVSGQTVASELSSAVSNALSFLSTALLVFALISLFVGRSRSLTRSRSRSGSGPGSWRCCAWSEPAAARCSARCSARPSSWDSPPP